MKYVSSRSWLRERHAGSAAAARRARALAPAALLQPVIGSFLGDDDVVDVALLEAGAGDPHEARLGLEIADGADAGVAHPRPQAAHELLDHRRERPLVG